MKVLGLIPARGGSKGIPHKNISEVAGKPLIAWSIEVAKHCSLLDRTIVSTDDLQIAEVATTYGAEVPFLRPAEFATDDTPDFPVYNHALRWLADNENYYPDIVVWLRPTTPLRSVEDVRNAIDIFVENGADCVRSVCLVEHHPFWMKRLENQKLTPFINGKDEHTYYQRQLLPPVYRLNGAIDVVRRTTIVKKGFAYGGEMFGYVMPPERSIDIDNALDMVIAEHLLLRKTQ